MGNSFSSDSPWVIMKGKDGVDRFEVELAEVEVEGGHDYIPQLRVRDEDENIRFEMDLPESLSQRGGMGAKDLTIPSQGDRGVLVRGQDDEGSDSGHLQDQAWPHASICPQSFA